VRHAKHVHYLRRETKGDFIFKVCIMPFTWIHHFVSLCVICLFVFHWKWTSGKLHHTSRSFLNFRVILRNIHFNLKTKPDISGRQNDFLVSAFCMESIYFLCVFLNLIKMHISLFKESLIRTKLWRRRGCRGSNNKPTETVPSTCSCSYQNIINME
jgi:hypothetical protein